MTNGHRVILKIDGGQVVVRVWNCDDADAAISEARRIVAEMGHKPLGVLEIHAGENCGLTKRV